jgi:hypothetical protein
MMRSRPAWIHSKTPSQKHKQKLTKKKKKTLREAKQALLENWPGSEVCLEWFEALIPREGSRTASVLGKAGRPQAQGSEASCWVAGCQPGQAVWSGLWQGLGVC